jgi:protoheme IX farnesyltransferase
MSSVAVERAPALALSWRDLLVLLKLRIDTLIVMVALASAVAAGQTEPGTLGMLGFACLLASAGASSINHYVDRELDARMERTRNRPIPSGRMAEPRIALWLGAALVALSQAVAVPLLGPVPALYLLGGALTYAVVYSWWLKPRTPFSIVVGGAAGSFAVLAGWQTGSGTWAAAPLALAAVLFLWTPSHFWSLAIALEDDYRAARVPMLSAVAGPVRTAAAVLANTVALVAFSLLLAAFLSWPYLVVAVPAGVWYLTETARLRRSPDRSTAWRAFKLSGLYLLCLLVGLVLTPLV